MAELTKEWLIKAITELEEERDATPGAVNEDAAMALAAMKLALASIEAEPVKRVNADQMHRVCLEANRHLDKCGAMAKEVNKLLGRAAPPAPVSVPDELSREEYKRRFMDEDNFDDTFRGGWNACRAAMLQDAEHVSNRDELPDGWVACSERMPEIGSRVIVAIEEKYVRSASYTQWDGAKTERGRAPRFEDLRGIVHGVTHWQPLPSPPAK